MPELDSTYGRPGAVTLAQRIEDYWRERDYPAIQVEVEEVPVVGNKAFLTYLLRSNIGPDGFPPAGELDARSA